MRRHSRKIFMANNMKSTASYRILFDGEIQEGQDLDEVKAGLCALFRTEDRGKIDGLFRNTPKVLKKDLSEEQARKYQRAFEKTGAYCRILEELPEAADVSAPQEDRSNEVTERSAPEHSQESQLVQPEKPPQKTSRESRASDILDVPCRENSRGQENGALFRPCEQCGRTVGPDRLECDERKEGACPFKVLKIRGSHSNSWLIPFCFGVLLLFFSGIYALSYLLYSLDITQSQFLSDFFIKQEIELSNPLLVLLDKWWWVFFLLGLLGVGIGWVWGKACHTDITRFYNQRTGELVEWRKFFGRSRKLLHVSAYERIVVPGGEPLPYPSSLSALDQLPEMKFKVNIWSSTTSRKWADFAQKSSYYALIDLVSRNVITLYHADLLNKTPSREGIEQQTRSSDFFLLGPGPQSHLTVQGSFEEQLVKAVLQHWAEARKWCATKNTLGRTFRVRQFFFRAATAATALEPRLSVGRSLAGEFLVPDAAKHGLIDVDKNETTLNVHILPKGASDFAALSQRVHEKVKAFEASHPRIAEALQQDIRNGIIYAESD